MTSPENIQPEESLTTNTESEQPMGRLEKIARVIGGYGLGFLGFGLAAGSIATGNVATGVVGSAVGLWLIYGADKILQPFHEEVYGPLPENETRGRKVGRFATFAGGLGLTYFGAGLLWGAVVPNSITHAGLNFGERVFSGGLGAVSFIAGDHVEERSRTNHGRETVVQKVLNHYKAGYKEGRERVKQRRQLLATTS